MLCPQAAVPRLIYSTTTCLPATGPFLFAVGSLYDSSYCIHTQLQSILVTTQRQNEQQLRQRSHWRSQDSDRNFGKYRVWCLKHRGRRSRYGLNSLSFFRRQGEETSLGLATADFLIYRRSFSWARGSCHRSDWRGWEACRRRHSECGNRCSKWNV